MRPLLCFLLVLFPTALCVSRIQSDERDNLLIDAGVGKNITAFADSMLLNGKEIVTKGDPARWNLEWNIYKKSPRNTNIYEKVVWNTNTGDFLG